MNSFAVILLLSLTLTPLVVRSDFCSRYLEYVKARAKELKDETKTDYAVKNLKFIATKNMLYLYLINFGTVGEGPLNEEFVYEFELSCKTADTCPTIGPEKKFSEVFGGVTGHLKNVFIHDGFTYFFTETSTKVFKFENKVKIGEIEEKDFWKNITHATVYEWKDNVRTVKSRFIPPKSPEGPPRFGFSFGNLNGTITVEVQGNYEMVNFVKHVLSRKTPSPLYMTIYTFGDYFVPTEFFGYLPLPDGDDIFNYVHKPFYVRKDEVSSLLYSVQDLVKLFGCDKSYTVPERTLWDTRSDNIYPSYFKV